ncbi:unnamed protein product [Bursaphelenchus okinawaensis]|uniref:Insulin-like domain-containing protein n=1 Tax=Bursaphelenchus okinawaensis TaxID=465554 RepID=A0A811L1B3_9BILA|nr:unnamed protein product [Bursaphelenchus okinawaensis]CAG9115722.1 unnamed protein product [Bursaphelenchus okinawaensis]
MKLKLTFSFASLTLLLTIFLTQSNTATANFRLCGFKLTTTLQHLCKHQTCGGYQVETRKRSIATFLDEISTAQDLLRQNDHYSPKRPFESSHPLLKNLRIRKRAGIATECCEKRCNLAYLRTYCCAGFEA